MFLIMEIIQEILHVDDIVDGIIKILDTPASTNPNWNSDQPDQLQV